MAVVTDTPRTWGRDVVVDASGPYPMRMYAQRRRHCAELLLDARRFAEREHVVQGGVRLMFSAHEEAVLRAAARLRELGVSTGDHVLLLGHNSVNWVVAFWAVLRLGGVAALG